MPPTDLTLHEAAERLGVHYMTAYRYVRLGLLAATKSGGTWKVGEAELAAFRAGDADAPAADRGGRRRAPWPERLEARLLAGDARGAWGVVEAALTAGVELDEVYLDVIAPAMVSVGERWARGELDVSLEHRASGIVMRLIGRLGPRCVRPGRTRGTVVVGAPPGERHALPAAILADLVRRAGWEVSDLGADVPVVSFVHAVVTTPDVAAVAISVTNDGSLAAAGELVAALRAATSGIAIVVGGRAVQDSTAAAAVGADAVVADARAFVALLEAERSRS